MPARKGQGPVLHTKLTPTKRLDQDGLHQYQAYCSRSCTSLLHPASIIPYCYTLRHLFLSLGHTQTVVLSGEVVGTCDGLWGRWLYPRLDWPYLCSFPLPKSSLLASRVALSCRCCSSSNVFLAFSPTPSQLSVDFDLGFSGSRCM